MADLADWNLPYGTDAIQDLETTAVDRPWLRRNNFETAMVKTTSVNDRGQGCCA
jgi:hypothetical protein